ncbi:uncharacterized protein [Musca autumnalis]|uniref:uncharacterized protein n=1 Tax=Musca autumnalis TaxID=221902 RepID=UPI003CF781DC
MEKSTSSLPKCRICHERHFLKSRPTFHDMDVNKRRNVAREKGFCFNCLCTAHKREWCPSRKTCMVCHKGHHTMLHVDAKPTTKSTRNQRSPSPSCSPERRPNNSRNNRSINGDPKPKPSSSTTAQRHRSNVSERLSCRTKTHIFLPTALAKVITTDGCDKVRLLLNSGKAHTIISVKLVDRLQLKITQRAGKTYTTVNLQSFYDHSVKIQILGEVKNHQYFTSPEPTKEKHLQSIYNHLNDLADPHFFNPINVEIIIANDQIPKIIKAGLIQTASNMPIAQSSTFGWIISGGCQY